MYTDIQTSINFVAKGGVNPIENLVQTGNFTIFVVSLLVVITIASAFGIVFSRRLVQSVSTNNLSLVAKLYKAKFFHLLLFAATIGFASLLFINVNFATAEAGINAPESINAYVDESGNVSFDDAYISSKDKHNLKFHSIETQLGHDVAGLDNSVWKISLDNNAIYEDKIPGSNVADIKVADKTLLQLSVENLSPSTALSLIGKQVFTIKFSVKELPPHEITIDPNNGDRSWTVTVADEDLLPVPDEPSYAYHSFAEWQKDGITYDFTQAVVEDFTLIAKWNELTQLEKPVWIGNLIYNAGPYTCEDISYWNNYNQNELTLSGDIAKIDAGTYTASFTPKEGYCWKEDGSKEPYETNWSIAKRDVSFVGKSDSVVFTGNEISISEVVTSGLVEGHISDVGYKATGTVVGEYEGSITPKDDISILDADDKNVTANYNITSTAGVLTITPTSESWTISLDDYSTEYNGSPQYNMNNPKTDVVGETIFLFSFDNVNFVNDLASLTKVDANVDGYIIYVKASNANYTTEATSTSKLIIKKRNVKFVGGQMTSVSFNGQEQTAGELKVTGLINGHTHNVEYSAAKGTVVGEYTGSITAAAEIVIKDSNNNDITSNYNISSTCAPLRITVNKSSWTISLNDSVFDYDDTAKHNTNVPVAEIPDAAKSDTVFKFSFDNQTWSEDLSSLTKIDADEYIIYVSATNENYFDPAIPATSKLIINKRNLEFKGASGYEYRNGTEISIDDYQVIGLLENHTHNINSYIAKGTEIGDYPGVFDPNDVNDVVIKKDNVVKTQNYNILLVPGTLHILAQTEFQVVFENSTFTFDNQAHSLEPATSTAMHGTTEISYSLDEVTWVSNIEDLSQKDANPDGYIIYAKGTNSEYEPSTVETSAKLIINKAKRNISLSDDNLKLIVEDKTVSRNISYPKQNVEVVPQAIEGGIATYDGDDKKVVIQAYDEEYKGIADFSCKTGNFDAVAQAGGKNKYKVTLQDKNFEDASVDMNVTVDDFLYISDSGTTDAKASVYKYIPLKSNEDENNPTVVPTSIIVNSPSNFGEAIEFSVTTVGESKPIFTEDKYAKYIDLANVEVIKEHAFEKASQLKYVKCNNVCKIDMSVVDNCANLSYFGYKEPTENLNKIELSSSITTLYPASFCNIRSQFINKVDLSACNNLDTIDIACFSLNESISSVILNPNIKYIKENAFSNCRIPAKEDGIVYDSDSTAILDAPDYNKERLLISNNINVVADSAFKGNESLRKVLIENPNVKVNDKAFSNCVNLESFVVKSSESKIEYGYPGQPEKVLENSGSNLEYGKDFVFAGNMDESNFPNFTTSGINSVKLKFTTETPVTSDKNLKANTYYYLNDNIKYQTNQLIAGSGGNIAIDFNGHTIDCEYSTRGIMVRSNTKLIMMDTSEEMSGKLWKARTAKEHGGGFRVEDGVLKLYAGNVKDCRSADNGGGVVLINENSYLYTFKDFSFEACMASQQNDEDWTSKGGGIHCGQNSHVYIDGTKFIRCYARDGGAIFSDDGGETITIKNATFIKCRASVPGSGGAIYNKDRTLIIENTTFESNCSTASKGGAIYNYGRCTITLTNCKFYNNWDNKDWSHDNKGALYSKNGAQYMVLTSCEGQTGIHTDGDW